MKLWYLCHRLAAPTRRAELVNLESAEAWLAALLQAEPGAHVIAPWITSLRAQVDDDRDPAARARAMERNLATVRRCDGVVLCGPVLSAGMRAELREALEHDLAVAWLVGRPLPTSAATEMLAAGARYWRAHLVELAAASRSSEAGSEVAA